MHSSGLVTQRRPFCSAAVQGSERFTWEDLHAFEKDSVDRTGWNWKVLKKKIIYNWKVFKKNWRGEAEETTQAHVDWYFWFVATVNIFASTVMFFWTTYRHVVFILNFPIESGITYQYMKNY